MELIYKDEAYAIIGACFEVYNEGRAIARRHFPALVACSSRGMALGRYESASGLARDVERYLQDETVEACPPSTRYRMGKFLRKHRAGVLTTVALLGLLTVTSGTIAVSAAAASQFMIVAPSSVTSGQPFNLTVTAVDAYGNIVTGYPGAVQITSGGNTLASGTLTDGVGTFSLTLTNTAKHHQAQQQTITVTDGTITSSIVVTVN